MVRQVIQGGGNMPAYGNNLSQQEVKALVTYLVSLKPSHTVPAQIPSRLEKVEPGKEERVSKTRRRSRGTRRVGLFGFEWPRDAPTVNSKIKNS